MSGPDLFRPEIEGTAALPAVTPTGSPTPAPSPSPRTPPLVPGGAPADRWTKVVAPPAVPEPLAPVPGPVPPPAPELEPEPAGHLDDPIADAFHLVDCACSEPQRYPGHVEQYAVLAEATRRTILAEQPPAVDAPAPIEAKVWAGTWGTLGATVALALVDLLLDQLGVLPSLFGGPNRWAGPTVLVLGVVLPPLASFIRGYLADHTPRASDPVPGAVKPVVGP